MEEEEDEEWYTTKKVMTPFGNLLYKTRAFPQAGSLPTFCLPSASWETSAYLERNVTGQTFGWCLMEQHGT